MGTRGLRGLLVTTLALLAAGPFAATERVLRVGTSGDYAPFSVAGGVSDDALHEPTGFDPDVARAFARDHGLALRFVRFRWPELLSDLGAGRFDVAMSGVTQRPERSLVGRFTLPVATSGAVALLREDLALDDVAELDRPGLRIAVNAGGHLEQVARARFEHAEVEAIDDNRAVLDRLLEGHCDAVVTDTLEAPHWRARAPSLRLLGPLSLDRKAYLVRADDAALAAQLDAWLLAREADGSLSRLRALHLGTAAAGERTAEPLAALLAAIDERLSLMPLVAEVKRRSGAPVEAPEREARVIESALAAVRTALPPGRRLDEPAVRGLFREQIEAAKEIQRAVLAAPPGPAAASAARAADLERELRPALMRIGDRIARLLVALPPGLPADGVLVATRRELRAHGLTTARLDAIAKALLRVASSRDSASGDAGGP